jgi:light-regulated signal transduction histidine kinase (bacteriophytochrome)
VRMVGVISDISERKRLEEALEEHRRELTRSNAELSLLNKEMESFSYSVSHDLRAPLRHIDGFARIMLEEHSAQLSQDAGRYLDQIIGAANRMGVLIDDLLNLSRIGRREMVLRLTNLDALVKQALADLPPGTENRRIEWKIQPLGEATCDAGLVKLIFSNLLSNAVKFTRTREVPVIEVGKLRSDGVTSYFVRDNGVGFDPRYADKLFGVFQRLHNQRDFEGTGVGLATVRRIVQRHGGEIWADSQLDRGANFAFTLAPHAQSSAPREASNETEVAAADGHQARGDSSC